MMFGFQWGMIDEYLPLFVEGTLMTLKCTVICVIAGTFLGLLLGVGRLAEARHGFWKYFLRFGVRLPVRFYVSFFRGTPLFVQILLIHFALMPTLINPSDGLIISGELAREIRSNYGAFVSAVLAISLNAGAYVSEIFRAGIQSVDQGQGEAARSLGMSYFKTLRKVVLPQAFRRMLPPLGNNAIAIVKDSSLASAIGLAELAYAARTVSGAYARYWEPYLTISAIYWVITLLMSAFVQHLETRYGKGDTRQ
ncbi:amino acid ABC transporter permease [uncultured Castellaniella sp.]|uniref:amino acid ABC transporter permease n=1 Tax=uncultured Castellaniella sp. TaxID=647907 RepID=UPI002622200F|nr:amino acid ABC transporter permease [uncultured Castellaniella sp.]